MNNMNVKRVRVELEMEDGTVKHVECTKIVDFDLGLSREPRETTWEQLSPSWRTFEPGPYVEIKLAVTAMEAELSA